MSDDREHLLQDPAPRWKASSIGETAREAAENQAKPEKAPTLRRRVLADIERRPAIPEMVLGSLRQQGVKTVLTSVRPRCSELARMGLIKDSGLRLPGEGGGNAIVWTATSAEERALFAARQAAKTEKDGADG